MNGTNFWALDGNEYLPASLSIHYTAAPAPVDVVNGYFQSGCIASNLVMLDTNGSPQYQYGLFDRTFNTAAYRPQSTNALYFAIEGTNLAGFYTPQAERGVGVPVDSEKVVTLLCGINEHEKAVGLSPTQWTQGITEWIDVPETGEFVLNFVPVDLPEDYWNLYDAFTGEFFTDWTYDAETRTVTLTDPSHAPSCLIACYNSFFGGLEDFTPYYDEDVSTVVPALTKNRLQALAGISLNTEFVRTMQDACENLITLYVDHNQNHGDFSNMPEIPHWQSQALFEVVNSCHSSWRRMSVLGALESDGHCLPSDYIGTWLFDDMKAVLSNLQWTTLDFGWASSQSNAIGQASVRPSGFTTIAAAKDDVEAHLAPTTWAVPCAYTTCGWYPGLWFAGAEAAMWRAYCYAENTSAPQLSANAKVDLYFYAGPSAYDEESDDNVFEDNGDDIIDSGFVNIDTVGSLQRTSTYDGSGKISVRIGDDSLAAPL